MIKRKFIKKISPKLKQIMYDRFGDLSNFLICFEFENGQIGFYTAYSLNGYSTIRQTFNNGFNTGTSEVWRDWALRPSNKELLDIIKKECFNAQP